MATGRLHARGFAKESLKCELPHLVLWQLTSAATASPTELNVARAIRLSCPVGRW